MKYRVAYMDKDGNFQINEINCYLALDAEVETMNRKDCLFIDTPVGKMVALYKIIGVCHGKRIEDY